MRRATGKRDQAIILTLLDTGLRASELSALKIGDVDLKTGKVLVKHGRAGRRQRRQGSHRVSGQSGATRRVAVSGRTRKMVKMPTRRCFWSSMIVR